MRGIAASKTLEGKERTEENMILHMSLNSEKEVSSFRLQKGSLSYCATPPTNCKEDCAEA